MDGLALSNLIQGAGIGYSAARSESERLAKSRRDQDAADMELEKERMNMAGLKDAEAKKKAEEQDYKDWVARKNKAADGSAPAADAGLSSVQNAAQTGQAKPDTLAAAQPQAAETTPAAPTIAAPAFDQNDPASFNIFMRDRAAARGDQAAADKHHAAYQSAVQTRLTKLASAAQAGLETGDPKGFIALYNTGVMDGKHIVGQPQIVSDQGGEPTYVFKLDSGEEKRVTASQLAPVIAEVAKPGTAINQKIMQLDEAHKQNAIAQAKIAESKATGQYDKNMSEANLNKVKADNYLKVSGSKVGGAKGEAAAIQMARMYMAEDPELTFDDAMKKVNAGKAKDFDVSFDPNSGATRVTDRVNGEIRVYDRNNKIKATIPLDPNKASVTEQQPAASAPVTAPANIPGLPAGFKPL